MKIQDVRRPTEACVLLNSDPKLKSKKYKINIRCTIHRKLYSLTFFSFEPTKRSLYFFYSLLSYYFRPD